MQAHAEALRPLRDRMPRSVEAALALSIHRRAEAEALAESSGDASRGGGLQEAVGRVGVCVRSGFGGSWMMSEAEHHECVVCHCGWVYVRGTTSPAARMSAASLRGAGGQS